MKTVIIPSSGVLIAKEGYCPNTKTHGFVRLRQTSSEWFVCPVCQCLVGASMVEKK